MSSEDQYGTCVSTAHKPTMHLNSMHS
jgi:hypothetical protein